MGTLPGESFSFRSGASDGDAAGRVLLLQIGSERRGRCRASPSASDREASDADAAGRVPIVTSLEREP